MITSRSNDRVKWVRRLLADRAARYEDRAFVVEGWHWLGEAARSGHPIRLVLHREVVPESQIPILGTLAEHRVEISAVSDDVLQFASDTESPSGVIAVLDLLELPPDRKPSLALVLDQLSDPGNMGTILRTALAAQVEVLYLLPGTVDPFNPKVLRAAVGAHLQLPILWLEKAELAPALEHLQVILAEARAGREYDRVNWNQSVALVIGSESHGVSPELRSLGAESVHIPISPRSESLNAAIASAVILFEIQRQRRTA